MRNEEMKKRIASEQQCMRRITNNDLVCKDCIFAYDDSVKLGNTSTCDKFTTKPNQVLVGGDCDEHESNTE